MQMQMQGGGGQDVGENTKATSTYANRSSTIVPLESLFVPDAILNIVLLRNIVL